MESQEKEGPEGLIAMPGTYFLSLFDQFESPTDITVEL